MSVYKSISNFGQSSADDPNNNPLTYCLINTVDSGFIHGGAGLTISGKHSNNCQAFMASYCANKWDNVCEYASHDQSMYPNMLGNTTNFLTSGQTLIANAASRKYISKKYGTCDLTWQPFDPTVASSPLISFWEGKECVRVYEVNPKEIDNDPLMNKILQNPIVAWSILVNIYNTALRNQKIDELKGTKIYSFFMSHPFQNYIKKLH